MGKVYASDRTLRNLLAVIHRDGGHYTEAGGLLASAADAEMKCITLYAAVENFYMDFKKKYPGEEVQCPLIADMFSAYMDINKQHIEYGNRDRSNDLVAPDIHVFVEADDG